MRKFLFGSCLLLASHMGFSQSEMQINQALNSHTFIPNYDDHSLVLGSKYLFDSGWARGSLMLADNREFKNDSVFYNYDKITQNIFYTQIAGGTFELNKNEVKSFVFQYRDSTYAFERVPAINSNDFFQILVKGGDKYSLYKIIHTHLKNADYTSNGISESGSKYDHFVDEPEYFILLPNKEWRSLYALKKNNILKAFDLNPDKPKVEGFIPSHSKGNPEANLKELIRFLNA